MKSHPITVTVAKIDNHLLVDPWLEEESVMDARITMAFNEEGNICAVQKGLSGYFTPQQILEATKIAQEKSAELRKKLNW
jgi:exosome complex component RRP42